MKDCCKIEKDQKNPPPSRYPSGLPPTLKLWRTSRRAGKKGFLQGILFGILPHSFCIAFIVFTVIGSTVAVGFFRKFLLTPYFFEILIGLSFLLATISATIYLKRKEQLSLKAIRGNWGYLGILFGTTIAVNLLLFLVIFPAMANVGGIRGTRGNRGTRETAEIKTIFLEVKIPCSGHAPLIIGEIGGVRGVRDVKFVAPNFFEVNYNPKETNLEKILSLSVFRSFPAEVKDNV